MSILPAAPMERRSMPEIQERPHRQLDGRSLAGAADGEIADRHHRTVERARVQHAARVEPRARAEQAPIAAGHGRQQTAGAGGEATLPPVHEPVAPAHGAPPV